MQPWKLNEVANGQIAFIKRILSTSLFSLEIEPSALFHVAGTMTSASLKPLYEDLVFTKAFFFIATWKHRILRYRKVQLPHSCLQNLILILGSNMQNSEVSVQI